MMDSLMTPRSVAAVLNVRPDTLSQWRFANRGPAYVKIGRLVRYREDDLTAWLEAMRVPSVDAPGRRR